MREPKNPHPRLRAARLQAGYAKAPQLAELAGLEPGTYRSYENGSRPLTVQAAKAIAPHLRDADKTWQWLLLGEDATVQAVAELEARAALERTAPAPPRLRDAGDVPEVDVRAGAGLGGEAAVEIYTSPDAVAAGRDMIRATWKFPPQYLVEELRIDPQRAWIIEIRGDSMAPTLQTGDRVVVDASDQIPTPDGVFAIWDGFGVAAKRLERIPNSDPPALKIISDNRAHTAYERTLDEVHVIGRIVWYGRRM
jgi:phage repressor protein C with HTH and peptisase S24 domain